MQIEIMNDPSSTDQSPAARASATRELEHRRGAVDGTRQGQRGRQGMSHYGMAFSVSKIMSS